MRMNFLHTIMKKLHENYYEIVTRHLVAQKIKEKAVLVVDRTGNDNLTEICAALHVAFGILDLDYELLSENRNPMRQGNTEQIKKLSFAI